MEQTISRGPHVASERLYKITESIRSVRIGDRTVDLTLRATDDGFEVSMIFGSVMSKSPLIVNRERVSRCRTFQTESEALSFFRSEVSRLECLAWLREQRAL